MLFGMKGSQGTSYSGSWSSTNSFFPISLHPYIGFNPSAPGELAGQLPCSEVLGITVYLAWLRFLGFAWSIYRFFT